MKVFVGKREGIRRFGETPCKRGGLLGHLRLGQCKLPLFALRQAKDGSLKTIIPPTLQSSRVCCGDCDCGYFSCLGANVEEGRLNMGFWRCES